MNSRTDEEPKEAAVNIEKREDFFLVRPRSRRSEEGKAFHIETIRISSKSDPYLKGKFNYGGIIIYGYKGKKRPEVNGEEGQRGYVVIMRTDTDTFEGLREKWSDEPGQVHGIIYRKALGESCSHTKVVGEGFSIMSGEFKTTSGVFNPSHDDYHNESWEMHPVSAECVKKVVKEWKKAGRNFEAQNYSVRSLLSPNNN